ncbi:hypothetical protein [Chitinophaga sancti]|uniref:Uncharacterized protein n=1 Tax=Chitinophaga sancti TaxID=1004 RepID=A0A1K1T326_9BACT|nr:hypothetical protein [Chitinophaga sancti]WQD61430.1 hypothetical protein U0033_26495 [Chitinophaga sancti]WQD61774.1 hypothetical protein U0033_28230 [Chitinophaga sancti]WQG92657.1 hypothetical protein SR876_14155 [Chitinophaga sancti]WQG93017.1 hypothetical protein SR876_15965 [Chitinophaga sancti]SFW90976.1 hypothetical protein SAMN05661012_06707 [Chitinophaga sancti]
MEKFELKIVVHNKKEEVPATEKLRTVWGSKERLARLKQPVQKFQTKIISMDDYNKSFYKQAKQ